MFELERHASGDTDYIDRFNRNSEQIERAVEPTIQDITADGDTLSLAYDPLIVYRVTATADSTIEITGWPADGVAASQEIVAVGWGDYAIDTPAAQYGEAGIPDFPTGSGRVRLIIRRDDAATGEDWMRVGSWP